MARIIAATAGLTGVCMSPGQNLFVQDAVQHGSIRSRERTDRNLQSVGANGRELGRFERVDERSADVSHPRHAGLARGTDQKAQHQRPALIREDLDVHRTPIDKKPEVFACERGDKTAAAVSNGRRYDNRLDASAEGRALSVRWLLALGARRRREQEDRQRGAAA